MNRLNFLLPDWTRIIWVSEEAKNVWLPRINLISSCFQDLEQKLVFAGHKPANLTSLPHNVFIDKQISLSKTEFRLVPLARIKQNTVYSNTSEPAANDSQYDVRCVLIKKELESEWIDAWNKNDNKVLGRLLGYPSCCVDFFQKYWVEEGYVDTTYPMSLSGTEGPKECNILLRWLGVRAVSHLPCSFNCEHTYDIAVRNIKYARECGYEQEMDWLEEMLDWPVSWSALHGIAEIKTPILKISSRTDATADKYTVDKQGYSYPKEGASGTSFPYINKSKVKITDTKAFKRGLELYKTQWTDNGFVSFEAMNHSHNVLLETISQSKIEFTSVIDLGCGNGELLKKISERFQPTDIYGIEYNTERFNRIKLNFSEGTFYNQDMFDKSGEWFSKDIELAIFMPGRLLEQHDSIHMIEWFEKNNTNVLLYTYADWTTQEQKFIDYLNMFGYKFETVCSYSELNCKSYLGKFTKKQKVKAFSII